MFWNLVIDRCKFNFHLEWVHELALKNPEVINPRIFSFQFPVFLEFQMNFVPKRAAYRVHSSSLHHQKLFLQYFWLKWADYESLFSWNFQPNFMLLHSLEQKFFFSKVLVWTSLIKVCGFFYWLLTCKPPMYMWAIPLNLNINEITQVNNLKRSLPLKCVDKILIISQGSVWTQWHSWEQRMKSWLNMIDILMPCIVWLPPAAS